MLRLATIDDAYGISKVHIVTWKDAYQGVVPSSYLDSLKVSDRVDTWRTQITDEHTYISVSHDQGIITGFLSGGISRDKDNFEYNEIYAIYVHPSYQGRGIGKLLVEEFLDEFAFPYSLWVLDSNDSAIGFYKSLGFSSDGKTKDLSIHGKSLRESRYVLQEPPSENERQQTNL